MNSFFVAEIIKIKKVAFAEATISPKPTSVYKIEIAYP